MKKHDKKKLHVSTQTVRALDLVDAPVAGALPSGGALFSCKRACYISQLGWTCAC
jgi:hypothetical protein